MDWADDIAYGLTASDWQLSHEQRAKRVAAALRDERKRCAEVVHSVAKDFYGNTDQMYAAALIASSIEATPCA